ncbi:MAG TPA: putative sulfate exporter family transporter, partial [Daejeonella sp.]|nr:putative sulfate exporter family transporter [Daejeonella sp.]
MEDSPLKYPRRILDRNITIRQLIFILLVGVCLTPWISAPTALFMGLMVARFIGHPFLHLNQKATRWLLQVSVVGLGFGMNVQSALQAGKEGFMFTIVSVFGTLLLGTLIGRLLKIDKVISHLISCGTAICGGSAIAAVSPVISAKENQISVALGTVFLLNSAALFIFPLIGHYLNLSETQFGLWSAIAIHDTSSVVGAAGKYGPKALEVATTVKLARALWIIPVVLGSSILFKNHSVKIRIPYFIGFFVLS